VRALLGGLLFILPTLALDFLFVHTLIIS
jgi:hypothetical protein